MRRRARIALALTVVALFGAAAAHAESPLDTLQRFLADPANVFGHDPNLRARPHGAPSEAAPLVDVPLPRLRPGDGAANLPPLNYAAADETFAAPPVPPAPALPPPVAGDALVPTPHLRPADVLPTITAPPVPNGPKLAALTPVPFPDLVKPPPAADTICMAEITAAGVVATPVPAISEDDGQCGIATPVSVTALEGGVVKLSPAATIDCSLAQHLAGWVHDVVAPQAEAEYGKPLTG
ncbi:MAG TPA: extensin family protein, partial [Bauldia sp.]|nr:extensin family protein [Bauldia sp.]